MDKHPDCMNPFCGVVWDGEDEPNPCFSCDALTKDDRIAELEAQVTAQALTIAELTGSREPKIEKLQATIERVGGIVDSYCLDQIPTNENDLDYGARKLAEQIQEALGDKA